MKILIDGEPATEENAAAADLALDPGEIERLTQVARALPGG